MSLCLCRRSFRKSIRLRRYISGKLQLFCLCRRNKSMSRHYRHGLSRRKTGK